MNGADDKLPRALRAALARGAPPMPADLKAGLLAEARRRAARPPSWTRRLRQELAGVPPGLGAAGLAVCAAALALILRRVPAPAAALDQVLAEHELFAQTLPLSARAALFAERAGALEDASEADPHEN